MNAPILDFKHQHAAHCESGVISSLLRHHGLPISEPMAFGLSSAILFAHFPFFKVEGFPLTAYRAFPGSIGRALEKNIGIRLRRERFRSPTQGTIALNNLLDAEQPAGVQASVYWLPYFPPDMRFHFNAHNLLVYGKQGDNYLISDPVAEHTVTCSVSDLEKARFVKGALAPKGLLYYPTHVPKAIDYQKAIPRSIRKTTNIMLRTPVPVIGVNAIYFLAKRIRNLRSRYDDDRRIRLFINFIVRMQEEIGTGGGGFRFMYASFLQESANVLHNHALSEASSLMTDAGDAWRNFALAGARIVKNKSEMDLDGLAQLLEECAGREKLAYRRLQSAFNH